MSPHRFRFCRIAPPLCLALVVLFPRCAAAEGADTNGELLNSVASQAWSQALLLIYCGLIAAASFVGGWLPTRIQLTHNRMQYVISFVGGLMLGIGMLHLLPHAIAESGSVNGSLSWALVGILAMYLLIRAFHVHHHGPFELPDDAGTVVADSYQHRLADEDEVHQHDCGHEHHRGQGHAHQPHRLSWFGIALGLGLHTLIDGVALGASVESDTGRDVLFHLYGLGTFLVILLHKPLDAVSITSLMKAGGWSTQWMHLVNVSFALLVLLGAGLFSLGLSHLGDGQREVVGAALAFSAGVFLCIALGDLLPEAEFHRHSRIPLTAALLLGILLAWAVTWLQPAHSHDEPTTSQPAAEWRSDLSESSIRS